MYEKYYNVHAECVAQAQKWLEIAISYQTYAAKVTKKFASPKEYPQSVFSAYRGYARCMEMYDACWSQCDAIIRAYEMSKNREVVEEAHAREVAEVSKHLADQQAKQDAEFINRVAWAVIVILGILFSDAIFSFMEWIAPNLVP